MKIVGIVAEYNPFHNGHYHQLEETRRALSPDGIVAVMSGNFVQRGQPAFLDKWTRAHAALASGVNLVVELPTYYATASAEDFASGAVSCLEHMGIVTHLSFGSEASDLEALWHCADILVREPEAYKIPLKEALNRGDTFPKARAEALNQVLEHPVDLNQSNLILGIEYLKSLIKNNSTIIPFVVKRIGSGYHDKGLETQYASATALRGAYFSDTPTDFERYMPQASAKVLFNSALHPVQMKNFERQLLYKLRTLTVENLAGVRGVGEGLEYKIKREAQRSGSYDALVDAVKSKRYTQTRIQRTLLNAFLDIDKTPRPFEGNGYIRVLGMDAVGRDMLRVMKNTATRPVITNINKIPETLKSSSLLALDIKATDLYVLGQPLTANIIGGLDHTRQLILL